VEGVSVASYDVLSRNVLVEVHVYNRTSVTIVDVPTEIRKRTPQNYVMKLYQLTFQCRPRCTALTYNTSHAAGFSAMYSRECI
jgi:hypothetical protein